MKNNPFAWIVASPINPHWLQHYKMNRANDVILADIKGRVLEVGAGDGARKSFLLGRYPKIKEYLATDYSSWDDQFDKISARARKLGKLGERLFGFKERIKLDRVCSALELPFSKDEFDYHLSFETLEHLEEPNLYFSEATRILKKGGHLALSIPFLYRVHGGEPDHKMDYQRCAPGFFFHQAEKNKLKIIELYSNTGIGTSVATLVNGWLIRVIFESSFFVRGISLIISPFVFLATNIIGWLLDIKPDARFATHFHVLMRKE